MSIQLVKRGQVSGKNKVLVKLIAVVMALSSIGIYLIATGYNPLHVYNEMVKGSIMGAYDLGKTVEKAVPILICALGVGIAFKMNFWNIGAEGQMLLGGFGCALIGLFSGLPNPLNLVVMAVAAMICGGLWAFIPAIFHVQWRTNDTILTLMMNYVALKFITYLQYVAWKDPKAMGFPKIANFDKSAQLPSVLGVNIGWIIALVLMVLVYIYMNYSKRGFESAVIGQSKETAKYLGMNTKKTVLLSVFLSGAICGLAGMVQASSISKSLSVGLTQDAGNMAIIVSWLSGLNPIIMVVTSFLFAALIKGGDYIQIAYEIPSSLAHIIQATVLFFVLGSEFFIRYEVRIKKSLARRCSENAALQEKIVAKEEQ